MVFRYMVSESILEKRVQGLERGGHGFREEVAT